MDLHRFRVFTLAEANRELENVARVTRETRESLERIQREAGEDSSASEALEQETRKLLEAWSRQILEIGAQPKGIFTVDFRSPDPNVLWCWAPEEREIGHRHFTWESFKDRVPLRPHGGLWPSRN